MKKRSVLGLLVLSLILILSGCSSSKPEDTVKGFMEGMKNFNAEEMASKVNPSNTEVKEDVQSLIEDGEEFQNYFMNYLKENAKEITYTVKEAKLDGDKATVDIDVKYVDGTPLFTAVVTDYFQKAMSTAFSGVEMTDEEASNIFLDSMKTQQENIEKTYSEKTITVNCIKINDIWYIDNLNDELLDVATSNIFSAADEMNNSLNSENQEESSLAESLESGEFNVIEKNIGDEIALSTINLKVTKVEETESLTSEYSEPILAKEGTKFILVSLDVMNTTKSAITLDQNITLLDNEEREFTSYEDSVWAIDDYLNYRGLSPSIKESGRFVYEVPTDSSSYSLIVKNADTNDIYKIKLK